MPEEHKPYHHGNLVPVLIETTITLIEEIGAENVTVREVAKHAGVSAGAPFRHFKSKTALMTAVAEQAIERLLEAVNAAQDPALEDDPLAQIERIGIGYLNWVRHNPTHFQVISNRELIDFESSVLAVQLNAVIRQRMAELLTRARDQGDLAPGLEVDTVILGCRAMVYGLARMYADGHFPEWQPGGEPFDWMKRTLSAMMVRLRA